MANQEIFLDTHLELVYSPLNVSYGIIVDGTVADQQSYDQSDGTYSPDYTKVYLVLKPWMRIVDPDEELPDGEVQMTNMHWYVYDGTSETEISNGTDYQVATDGRLSIRRNVDPGKLLMFRFVGQYQDPRTGEIWTMEDTHAVSCEMEAAAVRMFLNQPEYVEWDPTSDDPAKIVLQADLMIVNDSVDPANREIIWEKKDEGDADYAQIFRDSDPNYDIMDYDVSISKDGTELTLDRNLMGMRVDIRCRAKYDPYGNPSTVALTDRSPSAVAVFTRNVPKPDISLHTQTRFKAGQTSFKPTIDVYVGQRLIANPERFWDFKWYLSKGVAAGTVSKTLVGEGISPTLPTSYIQKKYGAQLVLGFIEKRPLAALTTNNSVIVDGSGNVIVA